jgi:hypothetical protein
MIKQGFSIHQTLIHFPLKLSQFLFQLLVTHFTQCFLFFHDLHQQFAVLHHLMLQINSLHPQEIFGSQKRIFQRLIRFGSSRRTREGDALLFGLCRVNVWMNLFLKLLKLSLEHVVVQQKRHWQVEQLKIRLHFRKRLQLVACVAKEPIPRATKQKKQERKKRKQNSHSESKTFSQLQQGAPGYFLVVV